MNENHYSEQEWQTLHEEIQARFRALANEVQAVAPSAQPSFGKTVTKLFPLFSHLSFALTQDGCCNDIIVGVDIAPEDGQWRIHADISDEEEGTIYFELPRTPFSVASFEELRDRTLGSVEQLIHEGKPALFQLLGTPTSVLPTQVSNLTDVARESHV